MKQNYIHITVILDRSGSMESIRDDTIGGFNAFLNQQRSEEGSATLTLVQFDSQDSYEVIHRFRSLEVIPELTRNTFVPRSGTPLLDAIGRGVNDLESSLAELKEDDKPSGVVIVIITDGQENESHEFTKEQIEKMIREKQTKDGWQFVFLSADMAAIDDALTSGVHANSTMAFDKTSFGTSAAMASVSSRISDYRSGRSSSVSFTEEDRSQQESETKRSSVPEDKIINIKAAVRKRAPKSQKRPPESLQSLLELPSIRGADKSNGSEN